MSSISPFLDHPAVFDFRQVSVSGHTDYIGLIRDKVLPLIKSLLDQKLINGFHFIHLNPFHLRLSSDQWDQVQDAVQDQLRLFNLPTELEGCPGLGSNTYGGEIGAQLVSIDLEQNSRQLLAIIEHLDDKELSDYFNNLQYAHQTIHHKLIQFGMGNLQEVDFHINEARKWYKTVVNRVIIPLEQRVRELEKTLESTNI